MAASDSSYFADFEHVKIFSSYFTVFEHVKNLIVILQSLNKSKKIVVILQTLNNYYRLMNFFDRTYFLYYIKKRVKHFYYDFRYT